MVKYYTKQKSKKTPATEEERQFLDDAIETAVTYIRDWKRHEVREIIKNPIIDELPVYIPVDDQSFIIGYHQVRWNRDLWELLDRKSEKTYFFRNKLTAVAFSLCYHAKKYQLAEDINRYEEVLIRLNNKQKHYLTLRKRTKLDTWKEEFYSIQLQTTEYKIKAIRQRLEKSLLEAKYLKIWNLP